MKLLTRTGKKMLTLIVPDTPPEQLGLHPKKPSSGSLSSSPGMMMQRGIYSIDSERGLSDTEINPSDAKRDSPEEAKEAKEDKKEAEGSRLERSPSRASFKAVATVARMGSAMDLNKKKKLQKPQKQLNVDSMDTETDSEVEETGDSGYAESKNITPVLDALKIAGKRRKSIKEQIDKTTTAVFKTAKQLYEGKQSTFKRTGGRQNSAGTQTSPSSSQIHIPGLAETPEPDVVSLYENAGQDKSLFVYLISDSNKDAGFRKNCIGKVNLPEGSRNLTLSGLRSALLKSEETTIRSILRNNKSFKFVTETYRFVAQNEQAAAVDDVYANQGVFVKLEGNASVPMELRIPSRTDGSPSPMVSPGRRRRMGSGSRIRPRIGSRHNIQDHSAHDDTHLKMMQPHHLDTSPYHQRSPSRHPPVSKSHQIDSLDDPHTESANYPGKHYSAFHVRGKTSFFI